MKNYISAYITIFMTLIVLLVAGLFFAMFEAIRSRLIVFEGEYAIDISMESAMAEYSRALWEQFGILAIDSTYGTAMGGEKNIEAHIQSYLSRNTQSNRMDYAKINCASVQITKATLLTDNNGAAFRRQAGKVIEAELGLEIVREIRDAYEKSKVIDYADLLNMEKENADCFEKTEEIYGENNLNFKTDDGSEIYYMPDFVKETKRGILNLIFDGQDEISNRGINLDNSISSRIDAGLSFRGNTDIEDDTKLLFVEYLDRYFTNYISVENGELLKDNQALLYQGEYILCGLSSDTENLKRTITLISLLRELDNMRILLSSKEKMAELEAAADIISLILLNPELKDVIKASLALGWAYLESLEDIKILVKGGKVPFEKREDAWKCSLKKAFQQSMGKDEAALENQDAGTDYRGYLNLLLFLSNKDKITKRAMDMVEADIRLTPGNEKFRLDACFDFIEANIVLESEFGYSFQFNRAKSY